MQAQADCCDMILTVWDTLSECDTHDPVMRCWLCVQMAMMKQVLELSGKQTMLLQGVQQSGGFNMSALQRAAGVSLPGLANQARCVCVLGLACSLLQWCGCTRQ